MQFMHPHFFRPIVREALLDRMPDVWDVLVEAGGITARPPGAPESMTALECRRSTYERAVRAHAGREPHVTVHAGHADRVLVERDRVTGVVVDGSRVVADLVLCATGRATRFADAFRGPAEGGPSGFSYVSRMYRARAAGSVPTSAFPMGAFARGYLTIVFPQDDRTLSALIVRASTDEALSELRRTDCFEAAARAIPNLARWTGPDEFEPITPALPAPSWACSTRARMHAMWRPGSTPGARRTSSRGTRTTSTGTPRCWRAGTERTSTSRRGSPRT
jgi:hypothetical protein